MKRTGAMLAILAALMPAAWAANTFVSVLIGGGYGSTGSTFDSSGNGQLNGTLTVDGTQTFTGATTHSAAVSVNATPLTVGANTTSATRVNCNGAAASTRAFQLMTAGNLRAALAVTNTAESGSNAGSNVALSVYDDAGAFIDSPMTITRASGGTMTLVRPVSATSTLAVTGNATAASADIGGGYGSTGVTISTTGNIQANGTLTVDGAQTLTGVTTHGAARLDKVVTLTDAATIATDASLGNVFTVTLGGNRTLGAPTNPTNGQRITYVIRQDATGSRTLGYNAAFRFSTTRPSPTLTTTAAKTDYLEFIYNSTDSKWDVVNIDLGH